MRITKPWSEYPAGTKAFAINGGHWEKQIGGGWKWSTGATFPIPGGDAYAVELPDLVPCDHPGCLSHVTHPCEGCGRIAGRMIEWPPAVPRISPEQFDREYQGHFVVREEDSR